MVKSRYIRRESWSLRRDIVQKFSWRSCTSSPQHPPIFQTKHTAPRRLSNRNTVLGDVAGLATVVTSLGGLVSGQVAVLGDVAALTARVALHSTGLAVLGKVVGATALVAGGTLGRAAKLASSWSWRQSGRPRLVLRTLSRDVAKLRAVVALGTLGAVWAVALDVTDITTRVTLLAGGRFWLGTSGGFVAGLATVVAQSLGLLAVVCDVAGLAALVTRSWEHFLGVGVEMG